MSKLTLTEFEYKNIITEVNFYCDYYLIKDKDFNSDFILSDVIDRYIKCKEKADYLNNEKIICATIKTICIRSVLNYIYKNNVNYNTWKLKENIASDDIVDQLLIQDIYKKIILIYDSLSEKEKTLYELLSEKEVSIKDACKLLNINKDFYINFINKMKKIIKNFI